MSDEGFVKTVTTENGSELIKFAYYVLLDYFKRTPKLAEEKQIKRNLAMWLRDKYPEYMIDQNAHLSVAKFVLNKKINLPPKKEILKFIDVYEIKLPSKDDIIYVNSRLHSPHWVDNEGNKLSDNEYIEERELFLSVNIDGGGDYKVTFSVYKQLIDGKYIKIAENLLGEKKEGTKTYITKWLYKRERALRRENDIKLYFRAHKNNYTETETVVKSFIDGIVAIETERKKGEYFNFNSNTYVGYGGAQQWYKEAIFFNGVTGWDKAKGEKMDFTGCGSIAATNIIYYYAQQFSPLFAKIKTSNGLKNTNKEPTQAEYMHMAFSVYNNYTMQTIPKIGTGIWFIDSLCDGIIKFAQERGISLKKHTLTNKILTSDNSFSHAVDFITEGLKNNFPIILLVTKNNYIKSVYNINTNNPDMAEQHFVTITSIKRTKKDEEDYELTISSWSKRKTIKSLKEMWKETPDWFDAAQLAVAGSIALKTLNTKEVETPDWLYTANEVVQKTAAGLAVSSPLTLKFASVSLGYCSFE
jgi:hypothetical protein